ncbi:GspH/FimT family pseudopilin [Kangiella koreensis]|uniref:General secretion pathway GspH domain-containing protein n=1 Tax=Kangiella koreensis (strain DSM 16069 / JCM 12317 / KCTC 12182 / SW-125) TaxID=523791 RepID=C7RCS4_KANKD|nr:GspH/FimT family protein [Kangiella koreensis]ACV27066.1 hypothetical protein Kkor_1654 [Kangiella koreensis DSM 16069]
MSWGSGININVPNKATDTFSRGKQSGFGLVETMFSILFLTGFLLSGCHLFFTLFSSKILDQTASQLIDSLQFARQVAIDTNSKVTIKPVNDNWSEGWEVLTVTSRGLDSAESKELIHRHVELKQKLSVTGEENLTITFMPNGMTTNLSPLGKNGMAICNPGGKGRHLTMLASGQVHVTDIKQECGISQ